MANKRIKDLGTTASTLAADDYVAIDGNANGTRKIVKGDLVNDISTQVAGTYLDEANNLSDVASKDTSKLNLEVPDVGTAPNEVPLNGQLGSMAYQSAEAVSVGTLEADGKTTLTNDSDNALVVETTNKNPMYVNVVGSAPNYLFDVRDDGTSKFRVDGSGRVGVGGSPSYELDVQAANARIAATSSAGVVNHLQADSTGAWVGPLSNHNLYLKTNNTTRATIDSSGRVGLGTDSPGSYNSYADDLVVGDAVGHRGITISSGSGSLGSIYFADGSTGTAQYRGYVGYSQSLDTMSFGTDAATQWQINSSGNLVAYSAGNGIDFGSGASTTLDDYEEGTWNGVYEPTTGSFAAITMDDDLVYTRIGNTVFVSGSIQTDNLDISGGSGQLKITGLPFAAAKVSTGTIGFAWNFGSAFPLGAIVSASTIYLYTRTSTTARTDNYDVSSMSTGASANRNTLYISATYTTS